LEEFGKVYWHEAHHEALQLELYEFRDVLEFIEEYELSKEALRMDTLIIKKLKDVHITKNIGEIFRKYNIVEYKSEKDNFTFWDYQKVLGYAYIFSAFEMVRIEDMTITISLTIYPRELFKILKNDYGFKIRDVGKGIYYVEGAVLPIQVLESKKLHEEENLLLRSLRSNLSSGDMLKVFDVFKHQYKVDDRNVYLDRLSKANHDKFKEVFHVFPESMKAITMDALNNSGWFNVWLERRVDEKLDFKMTEVARGMLLSGDSPEKVVNITKLSLDDVQSLVYELERS